MRAYEDQGTICIFLTAFGYLVVIFLRDLTVHGVQRPRAITIVEISLGWPGRLTLYCTYFNILVTNSSEGKTKRPSQYLFFPPFQYLTVRVEFETLESIGG